MKSKKNPKAKRFTGVPVIFMEGGIVQDVFIPNEKAKDGFTSIAHDIVDMDELKEGDDESIVRTWERLETETRLYFIKHAKDTNRYFLDAIERVDAKKVKLRQQFDGVRRMRNMTDICFGDRVLRHDRDTGDIQAIPLTKALDELTCDLNPKLFPNHSEIVKHLAHGKALHGEKSKFEYVLAEREERP